MRRDGAIVPAPGPGSGDIMEGQNHVIRQGRSSLRVLHIDMTFTSPLLLPKQSICFHEKNLLAFFFSTPSTNEKLSDREAAEFKWNIHKK